MGRLPESPGSTSSAGLTGGFLLSEYTAMLAELTSDTSRCSSIEGRKGTGLVLRLQVGFFLSTPSYAWVTSG